MSKFAKMIVTYKGKKYEYLINTEVSDLQMDKAVESILRDYQGTYQLIGKTILK